MTPISRTDAGAPDAENIVRRLVRMLAAPAIIGLLFAAPARAAEDPYDGNLRFTFTPYVWLPSLDGTLHFDLPNGSPNVDASAGDILSRLDFAIMGTGDVRRGNWSLFTDFIWAFEMTAVLLVIAVVGGVALARRSGQRPVSHAATPGPEEGS